MGLDLIIATNHFNGGGGETLPYVKFFNEGEWDELGNCKSTIYKNEWAG